jgi:hypothetical protein
MDQLLTEYTPTPFALQQVPHGAPVRGELESFVAHAFRDKHDAQIRSFMPELLGMRNAGGELRAVAGCRPARQERLFLEQYLEQPVEALLAEKTGRLVERSQIVEIGNLASNGCRQARHLVSLLPRHLLDRGYTWAIFTATDIVRGVLQSVGAELVELAVADRAKVHAGDDSWGTYYRNDPRVMAGYLPDGLCLSPRHRVRH